ncbi:MAG: hypothetical protein ACOY8P_11555 [Thermodesulfobacteriota bacterium]
MHPAAKTIARRAAAFGTALASLACRPRGGATAPAPIAYPSFAPSREMYVLHREFGRIAEIGMGGLRFTYFNQAFFAAEPPGEGVLFTANNDYLDGIPFRILSDRAVSLFFASKYFIKERRIRFGALTAKQTCALEQFILRNAHIPQLSYDARYADYRPLHATQP